MRFSATRYSLRRRSFSSTEPVTYANMVFQSIAAPEYCAWQRAPFSIHGLDWLMQARPVIRNMLCKNTFGLFDRTGLKPAPDSRLRRALRHLPYSLLRRTIVEPDGATDDFRGKSKSAVAGRLARHRATLPVAAQLDNALFEHFASQLHPQRGRLDEGPSKGPRALAECQLLLLFLLRFLPSDVLADDIFRQTDRAHAVPFRPEVVAREVALLSEIFSVDPDGRLPLQEPHGIRHAELRRDVQQQMHMVRQRVSFHQLHAGRLTQRPKNLGLSGFPNAILGPFGVLRG